MSRLPTRTLAVGLLLAAWGCSGERPAPQEAPPAAATELDDADGPDEGGDDGAAPGPVEIPADEVASWVDVHFPSRAAPGYNLVLYRRRTPMLLDMAGRLVHAWPEVRVAGRARLDADGDLLFIDVDGAVREVDWQGNEIWSFRLPDAADFPHHDLIRLANGNRLVLARDEDAKVDYLVEVDDASRVVWSWHARDHLLDYLGRSDNLNNPTHVNSVHELPENRHFDAGDERFRPGNILISARNLSTVLVLDRRTGEVTWSHAEGLDYQHEAMMVPKGLPGAGDILIFNNRFHAEGDARRSAVERLDPRTGEITWRYEASAFYSSTGGSQLPLANGNLLISSSRGGRVFEITPDGAIVWQWAPPYQPMRPSRVPADFTPQLRAFAAPPVERIERRDPRRHVDEELYRFARENELRKLEVDGHATRALLLPEACAPLLLPPSPSLRLRWGVDAAALAELSGSTDAVFRATIARRGGDGASETLLESPQAIELGAGGGAILLGDERVRLHRYANQPVEVCLTVSTSRADIPRAALFWLPPRVLVPGSGRDREAEDDGMDADLRARQLKALGYVD